jgi:DNA-binding GntR family transcriptional regulator
VLAQMLGDLISRSSLISLMYQRAGAARHSQQEHVDIVKAFAAKDEERAVRLMDEHLLHVEESLAFDRKVPTHDIAQALS